MHAEPERLEKKSLRLSAIIMGASGHSQKQPNAPERLPHSWLKMKAEKLA